MKKTKIFILMAVMIASITFQGCTNLDEEIYDKLPVAQFGYNSKEVNSLIAPIYRTLKGVFPANYFYLSECAGDMAITPTRKGGDWWDGGQFKELRFHTWTPGTSLVTDSYNSAMSSITACNKIYSMINDNETITDKEQILAEIRGVRAYWYYMLLDYYGNVPIVTDFKDSSLPATKSREEVYTFVLSELNAIKDLVRTDVSSSSYGKMTKGVVNTLLAKMYLNAMVWNPAGGVKWTECIAACDEVMGMEYLIEPNFKQSFIVKNQNSKEIIFPIVFSTSDGGNTIAQRTLHYLAAPSLGLKIGTWNGVCAMPDYVKAYDPEDKRIGWSFLTGPMKDPATGEVFITAHGRPLIHTVDVTMKYGFDADGWGQTEQEDGARCFKWEFESGQNGDAENDFAIFRLADVYLMKAEALVRAGGDNVEATRLVNVIRQRAFDDAAKLKTAVTLADVYQERRFELAWEGYSRQDMIRFGTFLNAIPGWKAVTPAKCLLFPIPRTARDANASLTQNPGY
ncbi:MAG TPA: RagB/SusD family nutrient uptake outer membrane protein [Prolixibacteraceae bacterium]|nr:RagB/SusD family nutrient uptake outer membrane protein [Prolixibacteraceae bacterium]